MSLDKKKKKTMKKMKDCLTTCSDGHGGQSIILIQDIDFDPSVRDLNAHSSWLHVKMFFFFFVYFPKRELRLFYERMSTLPTILIPQGKGGLTLCGTPQAPTPALVLFPH